MPAPRPQSAANAAKSRMRSESSSECILPRRTPGRWKLTKSIHSGLRRECTSSGNISRLKSETAVLRSTMSHMLERDRAFSDELRNIGDPRLVRQLLSSPTGALHSSKSLGTLASPSTSKSSTRRSRPRTASARTETNSGQKHTFSPKVCVSSSRNLNHAKHLFLHSRGNN